MIIEENRSELWAKNAGNNWKISHKSVTFAHVPTSFLNLFLRWPYYYLAFTSIPASGERKEKGKEAGHRWLTPVILATEEAEIRRIEIQSQTR
jgi:hypothetical protein